MAGSRQFHYAVFWSEEHRAWFVEGDVHAYFGDGHVWVLWSPGAAAGGGQGEWRSYEDEEDKLVAGHLQFLRNLLDFPEGAVEREAIYFETLVDMAVDDAKG